jgi:hypothetical protein
MEINQRLERNMKRFTMQITLLSLSLYAAAPSQAANYGCIDLRILEDGRLRAYNQCDAAPMLTEIEWSDGSVDKVCIKSKQENYIDPKGRKDPRVRDETVVWCG